MTPTRTSLTVLMLAGLTLLASGCGGPKSEPPPHVEAVAPPEPAAPKPVIEPEAAALLKRMSDTLAAAPAVRVTTVESHERVKRDGTKMTMAFERDMVVQRPSHAWLRAKGETVNAEGWYDGKRFTLRQVDKKMYAQAVVPPTLDPFFDYIGTRIPLRMPMADLFYSSPLDSYVGPQTSGRVVGAETLDGVEATHLAFTDPSVDFDIWISPATALPVKLVLTYAGGAVRPTSTMTFKTWDLQPKVDPAIFVFEPLPDEMRIRFAGQARPEPAQG